MNDLEWKQPSLVGGLIAGILSVIPLVSAANCCFCAWALVGGIVASKMLVSRSMRPVKSGEGAKVGLIVGLIASGIFLLVNLPMQLVGVGENSQREILEALPQRSSDPQVQEAVQKFVDFLTNLSPGQKILFFLLFFLFGTVVFSGFTALGGL